MNEYETMMDILSNFGAEKIIDCLREKWDASEDEILFMNTYADVKENKGGPAEPMEVVLTDPGALG